MPPHAFVNDQTSIVIHNFAKVTIYNAIVITHNAIVIVYIAIVNDNIGDAFKITPLYLSTLAMLL